MLQTVPHSIFWDTYLHHVVHNAIHDLALERLEHDGAKAADELGLAAPGENEPFAMLQDVNDRDDVAVLAGARSLDIRIELPFEELGHARPEEGRVEQNRVRQLFLTDDTASSKLQHSRRTCGQPSQ